MTKLDFVIEFYFLYNLVFLVRFHLPLSPIVSASSLAQKCVPLGGTAPIAPSPNKDRLIPW